MVHELLADRGAGLLSLDIINDSRNCIHDTIWDFTYMQSSFHTQSLSVHFSYVCESKKDYSLQWTTWRDYLT